MPIVKKQRDGRIIRSKDRNGREERFHATKGRRNFRIPQPANNEATKLIAKFYKL